MIKSNYDLKIGDWVRVARRSHHFNPHINNVGYKGVIVDMHETAVQIQCTTGGMGAVDIDVVEPYEPTMEDRATYIGWFGDWPEGTEKICE